MTVFLVMYMKCKGKLKWPECLMWRCTVKDSGSGAADSLNCVTGQGGVIGSWEDRSTHRI